MADSDGRSALTQGTTELGIDLSGRQIDTLLAYRDLLLQWSQHFNLISKADLPALIPRHILDSLAIHPYLDGQVIVDVGSGAGLPGIPLAIANPEKQFILLDSNGKKTRFLFQAKVELGLGNVAVENYRLEHYQTLRQVDIVTCRAFSTLAEVLDKAGALVHDDTLLLAMKGQYPKAELADLPPGHRVEFSQRLRVPGNNSERHLIAVKMAADSGSPAIVGQKK